MALLKIKASKGFIAAVEGAEWGSWEDAGCPESGHQVNVCQRLKTAFVIETEEEAEALHYALCTGTFAIADSQDGYPNGARVRAAVRVTDAIKAAFPHLGLKAVPNGW